MAKLKVDLIVDDKGRIKITNFEKAVSKSMKQGQKHTKLFNKELQKTSALFKSAIATAGTFFGVYAAGKLVKDVALAAARFETLGVVMKVVGNNAGWTGEQMENFSKGLEKTGISMSGSRQALTRMTQAQLDLTKSSELARIAQDAAVIGNINSTEAFNQMVYGIQSANVRVLRTIGINVSFEQSYQKVAAQLGRTSASFTETEKAAIRMQAVLEAGPRIAGSYEAAMDTAGKKLLSLERHFDNLKVLSGEAFTPILGILVDELTASLVGLNKELSGPEFKEWIESNKAIIKIKLPEYIDKTKIALSGLYETYNLLPDGITGPAGAGLIGKYLFGSTMGATMAALVMLPSVISDMNRQFGSLEDLEKSVDRMAARYGGASGSWTEPERDAAKKKAAEVAMEAAEAARIAAAASAKAGIAAADAAAAMDISTKKIADKRRKEAIAEAKLFYDAWDDYRQGWIDKHAKETEVNVDNALALFFGDLDKLDDELFEKQKEVEKQHEHMMENIQDISAEFAYSIFDDWGDGWAGAMDSMKELFFRTMAQMVSQQYIMPIIAPIVQSVLGGVASGFSSAMGGGTGGWSSALGLSKYSSTMQGWMGTSVPAFMGGSSSMLATGSSAGYTQAVQMGQTPIATGATYGSMFAGAGYGALGYSTIGSAVGLPQGGYSGVGSAIGGAGGAAVAGSSMFAGSALGAKMGAWGGPIGIAVGAILGGVAGSLFGGGGDKYTAYENKGRPDIGPGTSFESYFGGSWLNEDLDYNIRDIVVPVVDDMIEEARRSFELLPDGMAERLKEIAFSIPNAKIEREDAQRDVERWLENIAVSIEGQMFDAVSDLFESPAAFEAFTGMMENAAGASAGVIGNAFKNSIMTNDFTAFGLSVKDQVFSAVSDGILEAMMASEMYQGALQPLFYGVQSALDQSMAGGTLDADLFSTLAMPYLGQVNDVLANMQPAFDLVSQAIMATREAVYEGTTPASDVDIENVAGYTIPTENNINLTVNTTVMTDDQLAALQEILQNLGDFNFTY